MSQNAKLSQRIQPHEATLWVIEAIRAVETSLELSRGEVHRLTRELAEAKAQAGSADASLPDGWVAVPEKPTPEMRDTFCADPGSATYFSHTTLRCEDFGSRYRAMLSARPELPKEPSDVE